MRCCVVLDGHGAYGLSHGRHFHLLGESPEACPGLSWRARLLPDRGQPGGRLSSNPLNLPRWFLNRRGFTLLEMCTVLLIMAVMAGVLMPAIQSAFVEKALRDDSNQLSLMVKTAMLQSADQHRNYIIDLTPTSMSLHPEETPPADADAVSTSAGEDDSDKSSGPEDIVADSRLDKPNKLIVPDPEKHDAWRDMPPTSWLFKPGELCPATTVRMVRGDAWVELDFNALTGNVENESSYFP
jgi:prepilin-type N-terminal cleavage/methylation domain-containing protein